MPAETMERKAFRSLNGIEISSLLLDRQRQSRAVRAERVDDVLFPRLRLYPYTTIYIAQLGEAGGGAR